MTRFIALVAAAFIAVLALVSPARASTGTINVTPQSSGGSSNFSKFVIITLTGQDGSSTTTLGSLGNVSSFTGLEAGTYGIFARDLGAIIDDPREGSATVTIGADETADVTVNLISVGFPLPGPIFFP